MGQLWCARAKRRDRLARGMRMHLDRQPWPMSLRHFARVYGTVSPAEDGMKVAILRIAHGRGVLVGGTVLVHANATSSRFSRAVPVKRGVYRVLVQVTNGAQVSNYSQPLLVG